MELNKPVFRCPLWCTDRSAEWDGPYEVSLGGLDLLSRLSVLDLLSRVGGLDPLRRLDGLDQALSLQQNGL